MKKRLFLFAVVASIALASVRAAISDTLERAIYLEETKGELQNAARLYQEILDDTNASRDLQAQAQLRLGLCELKLGNKPRAAAAIEAFVQQFPEKAGLLEAVGQKTPSVLDEIIQQIEKNYITSIKREEIVETALRAVVGKLDAGSTYLRENDLQYLTPDELVRMNETMSQKFAGIGATLAFTNNHVEVMATVTGSPAARGLAVGDRILAVDSMKLPEGKELETAVRLLRGLAGTSVTALTQRGEVRLVRGSIRLASVHTSMADEARKIAHIRVTQLGRETIGEFEAALRELKPASVILDLRRNGGGLLSEAVHLADAFLDTGRIVTIRSRAGDQHFEATSGGFSGPVVVLVGRDTASAAEIVAAALQDNRRAAIVGERTFGQALVKSLVPLKEGLGALKLPTAAYFRPDGRNMNRYPDSSLTDDWGVLPDEGQTVAGDEEQLQRALSLLRR